VIVAVSAVVFIVNRFFVHHPLWDWLKLLIVPAVLAGGAIWFNAQQREREQETANNRAQDETLQAYLDGMAELLTDRDRPLHRAQVGDSLSTVARARTLTVLARLEGKRKRSVVQFLYETGLIAADRLVLDLSGADLSGADLSGAILSDANLSGAVLSDASLGGADLSGAVLSDAILSGAVLRVAILGRAVLIRTYLDQADLGRSILTEAVLGQADLSGADLRGAILDEADLRGAILGRANLRKAILYQADLRGVWEWTADQLSKAKILEGAIMPNGQKYEDWVKSKDRVKGEEKNSGPS